ncbi:ubiquinone/menaquinone biosynthesis methyltransferase, partial [Edaphobacter sp.]|uniref:ubiquinone/menaquinone biosynthesis methyltransferase n=1 Tax=Edaphobacter sp. TaxID=1934404 RepID=UPI002DBE4829
TYDRANHILTFGLDRWLWNRTAHAFRKTLERPEAVVLDLCCGTGDMTMALYKYRPQPQNRVPHLRDGRIVAKVGEAPQISMEPGQPEPILAADFSRPMLALAEKKFAGHNITSIEADALHLPFADNSIDLITIAYGFRNLASYEDGLAELHRVLRPGGQIGILECNRPEGLTGAAYNLYFKKILPHIGGLISGDRAAYTYLPASVERFPRPPRMLQLIQNAGFIQATWTSYTLGAAGLYRAAKP